MLTDRRCMWIILTYDIGVKRNSKALKICRKYLSHVQKSVFEGEITVKKLAKLKQELAKVIDYENDQVAIYEFDTLRYSAKEVIGYQITTDNVL